MKKSITDLLTEYFDHYSSLVDSGEVSYLSRMEELSLKCFAEWCDKKAEGSN